MAAVGAGAGQTEDVVVHRTVDVDGVVTVVHPGEGDAVAEERGLGRQAQVVAHVAVQGGEGVDFLLGDLGTGAGVGSRHTGAGDHHDGGQLHAGFFQCHIQPFRFPKAQEDVFVNLVAVAGVADGHLVGPADAHARNAEVALQVGGGTIDGSRGFVDGQDVGADEPLTVGVLHHPLQGGSRHTLCQGHPLNGKDRQQGDQDA